MCILQAHHVSRELQTGMEVPLLKLDFLRPLRSHLFILKLDPPTRLLADGGAQRAHAQLDEGTRRILVVGVLMNSFVIVEVLDTLGERMPVPLGRPSRLWLSRVHICGSHSGSFEHNERRRLGRLGQRRSRHARGHRRARIYTSPRCPRTSIIHTANGMSAVYLRPWNIQLRG